VSLRLASRGDLDPLAGLLAELGYPPEREQLAERLDRLLSDPAVEIHVAERDGRVVGFATLHVLELIERPPIGRLSAIVVTVPERRRGVGAELIERIETAAVARGCDRLELTSGNWRVDAHAFYRSLGFEPAPQRFLKRLQST
jgi:N-acetylglutamate synthase-like GNAT family acetyltransferase